MAMIPWRQIREAGDSAIQIQFGKEPSRETSHWIHTVALTLRDQQWPAVIGIIPGFTTILVEFDLLQTSPAALIQSIETLSFSLLDRTLGKTWDIPVLYGGEAGPDLDRVCEALGLSSYDVIAQHTKTPYRIFCIGFSPGFPLAGPLDTVLRLPRRAVPRTKVYPGAVAIAGAQTGIYPTASPGGWHLIGKTRVPLFNWKIVPPMPYQPGDFLRFRAISHDEDVWIGEEVREERFFLREWMP